MQRLAEEEKDRGRDATRCGMHNAEKKSEREREKARGGELGESRARRSRLSVLYYRK